MVRYLLNHRIAVVMAFLALIILGVVTYLTLPVSLLPDIDIPHISVHVASESTSARELENTVVAPLRRQLMQVGGLSELKSETRDGSAVVSLTMNYGVDIGLAFIEVNEKIDGAMNYLPKTATRPKAVKTSATDIPVLYLQMTLRDDEGCLTFPELSGIAENIVRRRLEQLPEIAMVDITGVPGRLLRVIPDRNRMAQLGMTVEELESALTANNVEPGSMTVRDGYYKYNIAVSNLLRSTDDVKHIKIRKGDRVMKLGDFADVELTTRTPLGYSLHNGKRAVTLALIKHGEEKMSDMNKAIDATVDYFAERYPEIEFSKTRSQTELLDFTISNLEQNLLLGLLLVFLVCILFMHSVRSSFIIGISIMTGIIITFLLFYLFRVSINIISMAGLILAVGMMIDNSTIVTENITQFRSRGENLMDACANGTSEMITPMLSSSLTTVAVFVPLVFMSGIAGAIFSDQAFSITAGLAASYIVGITLLPVLYYMFSRGKSDVAIPSYESSRILQLYDTGIGFCFRHSRLFVAATLATVPLCALLFVYMRHERLPEIDSCETVARIDWNRDIGPDENKRRVLALTDSSTLMTSAYTGPQDYILSSEYDFSTSEAEVYFRTQLPEDVVSLQERITGRIAREYPDAAVSFHKAGNVFEKIFSSEENNLEVRLHPTSYKSADAAALADIHKKLSDISREALSPIPMREQVDIIVDRELLALYNVDYANVNRLLRTSFNGDEVSTMRSFREHTPIEVAGEEKTVDNVIRESFVKSRPDKDGKSADIPLRSLVSLHPDRDLKIITAGVSGEYIPVGMNTEGRERTVMEQIRNVAVDDGNYDVDFAGSFFSNARMMKELMVILLVSVLLMYLILCAQFESFVQPLIVLLEIPVDIFFALLTLIIFGETINLMSAIGIIVTCGIIVNDSILKIDAINELRKDGMPLMEAIHTAGRRRLRSILMTSLTTIFAMVPVIFSSDMGSELQRPMAIAMTGAMIVGTAVSIFVIPIFYRLIYRKHESA